MIRGAGILLVVAACFLSAAVAQPVPIPITRPSRADLDRASATLPPPLPGGRARQGQLPPSADQASLQRTPVDAAPLASPNVPTPTPQSAAPQIAMPTAKPGVQALPVVLSARIGEHSDRTRFVIELSDPVRMRVFTLA
ncbi:MAG TPA: hypothetical protein VH000_00990, partial [Rhizomicrobium sp.]|nr:hypothetical protein [Rhizomicrobium sp.]